MIRKIGRCVKCGREPRPINSKGECSDCVYKRSHNGMTRREMAMKKIRDDSNINHEKKTSLRRRKTIKRESSRREMMTSLDEQTYQLVFERTEHRCEECGARLPDRFRDDDGKVICRFQYSHILTKSSHPELRHNPKNFNRLCMSCHGKWEFGDRDKMRIYESNKIIIQQLLRREK